MASNQVMKVASIAVPLGITGTAGFVLNQKRNDYLSDPILNRALMHLAKDQRVADFCGDDIQPGWLITRDQRPNENWVKYELKIKGASGTLKTKVIGDHLTHTDLTELEKERELYYSKDKKKDEKVDVDYVPVDFDAYSIPDKLAQTKGLLPKDEKIWRISSLTASVDDETKILVLP